MSLLIRRCRLLSMEAPQGFVGVRTGDAMRGLRVRENVDVLVRAGRIEAVGDGLTVPPGGQVIDARGDVLMPGFVDCHTHLCWAGNRIDEWSRRLAGESYLQILKDGGGIMSTVRAVRETPLVTLTDELRKRLDAALRQGITTIEIKSGYGLNTEAELKMLRAIRDAALTWPGTVVLTALLGHAMDTSIGERAFVERTINETLPSIHAEFPGVAVDLFCEEGAWTLSDSLQLLNAAKDLGHPLRVHADQFTSRGMVTEAVRMGVLSVDHLEQTAGTELDLLAKSQTFGVGLPITAINLGNATKGTPFTGMSAGIKFANLRELVDRGGRVCLATNTNPGSAPSMSIPLVVALGVRFCGLTVDEALTAVTINPAMMLGFKDRGVVAPGKRADLVLLRYPDYRELAYELGGDPVRAVIVGGHVARYYASA